MKGHQATDSKQDFRRLIRRYPLQSTGVVFLGSLTIIALVLGLRQLRQFLSPIGGPGAGTTVDLRATDHASGNSALPNSLTDGTAPSYDVQILSLGRTANGDVPNLFRIQGEVIYHDN